MKLLRRVFGVLDGAEAGVALSLAFLVGTTLAGALVVGMPLSVAWTLYAHGRIAAAGLIAALVVLAVVSVVRDLKR